MRIIGLFAAVCAAVALSGCSMFPVGPDLAKAPSPFGNAATIHIIDDKGDTIADIMHQSAGDTAVLRFGDFDSKTYKADMSWHEFDGGMKDGQDYWVAGVNLFQTADRSAYAVLRFPHGADMDLPMKADMMVINCGMRIDPDDMENALDSDTSDSDDGASGDETAGKDDSGGTAEESQAKSMAKQLTTCDFDTLDQVYAFLPDMLAKAKQEAEDNKGKEDSDKSNDYEWEQVTIKIP